MFGGSNYSCTLRSSAVCTNSYVNGGSFTSLMSNQLMFNVSVTLGSATNVKMKVLFSADNSNWFTEGFCDSASGVTSSSEWQENVFERVYLFTANGKYQVAVPVKSKWFTAAIACTSTTTGSLVQVEAYVGVA